MQNPFSTPTPLPATLSLISSTYVPSVFPTIDVPYRLAIVGEAPGSDEETYGAPFVGASGKLLDSILSSCGIARSGCLVGNVCRYRPPGNDIKAFGWEHEKVQSGLSELRSELASFKPNCILALGAFALRAVRGEPWGTDYKITDYRGSLGLSPSGVKVVPSLHPAYVLREYKEWVFLRFDCQRAADEARFPELTLPKRSFDLDLSVDEICHKLDTWTPGLKASVDIEGGLNGWTCISVSPSPDYAFIIAFGRYSEEGQGRVYQALSRFLYRSDIPKVLQNSLYDNFVLFYGFNMLIRNVAEDTMLKSAEIYPELAKGLDVQASIWTREPNWKHLIAYSTKEQKKRAKAGVNPEDEIRNKHRACCIDSSVTLEICRAQDSALDLAAQRHYRFNVSLLSPFLYMQRRGFAYNKNQAAQELAEVRVGLNECATRLETRVGYSLLGAKGSVSDDKVKRLLYTEKGYPVQYKGRGADRKITSDIGALLKLAQPRPYDPLLADLLLHSRLDGVRKTLEVETDPDGRVRCAYNIVGAETMRITCYESPTGSGANLQTITKKLRKLYTADPGHWLFQCDLAGADGWTVAAHCLRLGDPTMWDDYMFGLKPARIIALMYMKGTSVLSMSRDELKALGKEVDGDGWLYFACKRIQHATNYGVKEKTGMEQIMLDSYKVSGTPIFISKPDFITLQRYYLMRYPGLYQWHNWAKAQVLDGHNLKSASGHTRKFFGRRRSYDYKTRKVEADHDTWKEFLADEPQENTTYATNHALSRLWSDPENRYYIRKGDSSSICETEKSGPQNFKALVHSMDSMETESQQTRLDSTLRTRFRIEPLHQVHDALIGQFPKERTEWAIQKIRSYFANVLSIAGLQVTIPFEGAYGPSWGELGESYGGGSI